MDVLITSSSKTIRWLSTIKSKVEAKNLPLKYVESKYWASFRSPKTNRNIAYLQPQKNQVRLFTRLPPSFNSNLQMTPSSSKWEDTFPSIFTISSEDLINKAIEFIISSYKEDSHKY
jgi:hypothetical protein